MPALTRDDLTVEGFEDRMRLRRRMFGRFGVSVAALHAAQDSAALARDSVETCLGCAVDEDCARWLDAPGPDKVPPGFCANRRLIARLRAQRRFRTGSA